MGLLRLFRVLSRYIAVTFYIYALFGSSKASTFSVLLPFAVLAVSAQPIVSGAFPSHTFLVVPRLALGTLNHLAAIIWHVVNAINLARPLIKNSRFLALIYFGHLVYEPVSYTHLTLPTKLEV